MGGSAFILVYLLVFVAIIYMMVVIPQRKLRAQQQAIFKALSPGDEIVTAAGIYGTVTEVEDGDTVLIEVAQDTEIRIAKASVTRIITDVPADAAPAADAEVPQVPPPNDGTV